MKPILLVVSVLLLAMNASAQFTYKIKADSVRITSQDLTVTVTGAADGDVVSIGVPSASVMANGSYTA